MREPRLILSYNAVSGDPEKVADYSCHWCDKPATSYLFFGPQFCEEHNPRYNELRPGAPRLLCSPSGADLSPGLGAQHTLEGT